MVPKPTAIVPEMSIVGWRPGRSGKSQLVDICQGHYVPMVLIGAGQKKQSNEAMVKG